MRLVMHCFAKIVNCFYYIGFCNGKYFTYDIYCLIYNVENSFFLYSSLLLGNNLYLCEDNRSCIRVEYRFCILSD